MTRPTSGGGHRTQAERREHTRAALLDATIDCLVAVGYSRTSVQEVCARAGVSKGAVQHHFATKADLMAAAVEHLTHRISEQRLADLPPQAAAPDAIGAVIDLLWQGYSGTLASAAMELWIAARTDAELAAAMRPVDRALGRAVYERMMSFAWDVPRERVRSLFWLTVNLTRGLALDAEIGGDERRRKQLLEDWKRIASAVYRGEA